MNTITVFFSGVAVQMWTGHSQAEAEYQFEIHKHIYGKRHKIAWETHFCTGCFRVLIHEPVVIKHIDKTDLARPLLPSKAVELFVECVDIIDSLS